MFDGGGFDLGTCHPAEFCVPPVTDAGVLPGPLVAAFSTGAYRVFGLGLSSETNGVGDSETWTVSADADAGVGGEALTLQVPVGMLGTFSCGAANPSLEVVYAPDAGNGAFTSTSALGGNCSVTLLGVPQPDGGAFEGIFSGHLIYAGPSGFGSTVDLTGSFNVAQ